MKMADRKKSFSERVYRLVRRIPYGKVLAYGDVAALLGHPRSARGVGAALRALPEGSNVPWWRVINARGEIAIQGYGRPMQRMLLEAEGVRFERGGRVEAGAWASCEQLAGTEH